ncbi:MAG: sulfite exporter TauE/SafE family protein [Ilumatobacteraceae bacterium]
MTSQTRRIWVFVCIGVIAGFLSGIFGVGGGILVVPGLTILARMDQRLAHGTSLAAIVPISLASLITYWGHHYVDWPVTFWLACGAIVGSVLGTQLLAVTSRRTLGITFASVLIISAIRLFIATQGNGRDELHASLFFALIALGFVAGALAGLLGVGGGIVIVPALVVLFGIPSVIAKATSIAVIVPTAIMGTIRNRTAKNVDLSAALIVGCAGVISAIAGGFISAALSDTVSNILFAVLLVAVATRIIFEQLRVARA